MTPWIGASLIAGIIVIAMISDGQKAGMLSSKKDWAAFAFFLVSFVAMGALSYWLSGLFDSENRVATALALFFAGVSGVTLLLNVVNRVQQTRRMRQQGVLSKREWCRRVAAALAAVQPK